MAKLIKINGGMAIEHGGKIYPPMGATIANTRVEALIKEDRVLVEPDYLRNLGESGIKVFFVICETDWMGKGCFEDMDKEIRTLLESVPDALIILRIGIHPSHQWVEEHMEECIKYSDGSYPKTGRAEGSFMGDYKGCYTLYSEKWAQEAGNQLKKTYLRLKEMPYFDRIGGFFMAAGLTSEWIQPGDHAIPAEGLYGDFSESMKREFSLYLREKYHTEENLRKAWRNENASFDDPEIPDLDKRYYAYDARNGPYGVDYAVKHRNSSGGGKLGDDFYKNPYHIGSFLNVDIAMDVFDFFQARAAGTTRSMKHLGSVVKGLSDDLLVGAFFGYYGATHFYNITNITSLYELLESDEVDVFSAPPVYQNRQKGGFEGQRCMLDSMRIHNKMFIVEDDTRTHAEVPEYCQELDIFSAEDTLNILKRNFGRNICDDQHGWWFDQHAGGGRYKFQEVYDLFRKQTEIAHKAYSLDRNKEHEIAFIYDEESTLMVSPKTSHDTIEYMRNYEVARIGAGVDMYYHNDMANPDMPDYKLYVFFNTYSLTDEERKQIKKKLSKNHATALFMYAGGAINPDKDVRLSADNMSDLLGISMEMDTEVRIPSFAVTGDHMATAGMDKGRSYGNLDRHLRQSIVHYSDWALGNNERSYLCPCFYSNDKDAEVLATFRETGKPALVLKELKDYNVLHCGTKVVRAEVIRSIAKYAGCHIYMDSDDVLFQNKNYVVVHASSTGKKTVKLPKRCSPYEVYEEKYYGTDTDVITCDMLLGETKMFYIGE